MAEPPVCRQTPKVGAVCISVHVRILCGGRVVTFFPTATAFFVSCTDELEKKVSAFFGQRQIADFIDDEKRSAGVLPKLAVQLSAAMGLAQSVEQIRQCASIHAFSAFDRTHSEGAGQMAFPGPRRTEQMQNLAAGDKIQSGKRIDALFVQRRLEGKIKRRKRFDRQQFCSFQLYIDASGFSCYFSL